MRLDALANESRPIRKFVKEFSSKHQGLFQKVLHLFKKVLDDLFLLFFRLSIKERILGRSAYWNGKHLSASFQEIQALGC